MKALDPLSRKWKFFIDKCLPFGAAISCALFQAFSDAVAHIVSARTEKKLVNYLDDYFFVTLFKTLCDGQIQEFLQVCSMINFPVSLDKTFWGATEIVFLGLLINTITLTVSVPLVKIDKAVNMIKNFLKPGRRKVTLFEVQQLCGLLNFITIAVVPGRTFLRRLYAVTKGVKKSGHHIRLNREIRADLSMWLEFLSHPSAYARPFMDFSKILLADEIDLFTDASRNHQLGCGGHCGSEWFILQWDPLFMEKYEPSIDYLELFAVTIAVHLWIHKFENKRIILFCDNMSVVYMINKNVSHSCRCMVLLRIIVILGLVHNVRIFAKHVTSKNNFLADHISRMRPQDFISNARRAKSVNDEPLPIPSIFWPMNKLWDAGGIRANMLKQAKKKPEY